MTAAPAIRCTNVRKAYRLYNSALDMMLDRIGLGRIVRWRRGRAPREFEALRGIDLEIRRGERVGIIGRNGAGKTTLLKLLVGSATGNLRPNAGSIEVNGAIQPLLQIGTGFHPDLSGVENARAALMQNGLYGEALKTALEGVVAFAELGDFLHRSVKTYSLGMEMRLQFAVATAVSPEILIIDEILGAGDAYFLAKSAERMQQLAFSGCTLLLVSHSAEQILQYCERAIWLRDGMVAMDARADQVLAAYNSFSVALAGGDAAAVSAPASTVPKLRPFTPEPPAHAKTAFIDRILAHAEGVEPDSAAPITLPSGRHALRRSVRGGATVADVRISAFSDVQGILRVGDPIRLELEIAFEDCGPAELCCVVELYTLAADRVTRLKSPVIRRSANGRTVCAMLDIPVPLLGGREYLGTVSLVDAGASGDAVTAYDMLSQAIYLPVAATNDADPPLLHHSGSWFFGDAGTPVPARISSVQ